MRGSRFTGHLSYRDVESYFALGEQSVEIADDEFLVTRPINGGNGRILTDAVRELGAEPGPEARELAGYYAMIENLDRLLGRLIDVVRERGELEARPLRNVFLPGDAWLDTRDLVRVDADGDYWLVDSVRDVVHGPNGAVTTLEVEDVLGARVDAIDLVVDQKG